MESLYCMEGPQAIDVSTSSKNLNRHLQGMTLMLMLYDVSIHYRRGVESVNADGLSRQDWEEEEQVEKNKDVNINVILDYPMSDLSWWNRGTAHKEE